ncbi:hypothetical protein BN1723_001051, partial [Verticillium longisporum]
MFRKADIGATSMAGGWILGASWQTRWSSGHDRLSLIWTKNLFALAAAKRSKGVRREDFDNWRYGWAFSLPWILQRGRGYWTLGAQHDEKAEVRTESQKQRQPSDLPAANMNSAAPVFLLHAYDYEPRERTRQYTREETRIERGDPRAYADESYLKPHSSRALVPRRREDSDMSVEDIRRDFPPPGYRDARRTRSAEPGYYDDYRDDRSRRGDYYGDRRSRTGARVYGEEEEVRSRKRVLNQQEKIIAAVAGAALAFGGKELYDRRDAKEHGGDVERNYLTSAALGAA